MASGGAPRPLFVVLLVAALAAAGCTARDAPPEDLQEPRPPGDPQVRKGPPDGLPDVGEPPNITRELRQVPDPECLDRQPPDLGPTSTLIPANASVQAPHPAAFEGGYRRLEVRGSDVTLDAPHGPEVLPLPPQLDLGLDCLPGTPSNLSEADPPQLLLVGVDGTFRPDAGPARNLTDARVRLLSNATFRLQGESRIDSDGFVAREGRAEVQVLGTVPGGVAGRDAVPTPTLVVGDGGVTVDAARVETDPAPGRRGNATAGTPGDLALEPGRYDVASGRLAAAPETVHLDGAREIAVRPAEGNLTLRGQARDGRHVGLASRTLDGQVHPAREEADLTLAVDQWFEGSHPRIGAALGATWNRTGEADAKVTVDPGGNATAWIRALETSRVGTAVGVSADAEEAGPLDAATGVAWHPRPEASTGRQLVGAFFELLGAGTETNLAPGNASWTPVHVSAPEDADPGTYAVAVQVGAANADPATLELRVRVRG